MSQSLAQLYVHLVFSTKKRQRFFRDDETTNQLRAYLGGILRKLGCPSIAVGIPEDHVHILFRLSKTWILADVVGKIKTASSKRVHSFDKKYADFSWQGGYGAFSVSASGVAEVEVYIANQVEHHQKISFQDEFRLLLQKYRLEYDERYVWD